MQRHRLTKIVTAPSMENQLLGAIPKKEWDRFGPHLEPINLELGQVLYLPEGVQSHVYFPIDSIVSLFYVMEDGSSGEIAIVGREGLVGTSLFMGGESS